MGKALVCLHGSSEATYDVAVLTSQIQWVVGTSAVDCNEKLKER